MGTVPAKGFSVGRRSGQVRPGLQILHDWNSVELNVKRAFSLDRLPG
jgi:hypothetical protein